MNLLDYRGAGTRLEPPKPFALDAKLHAFMPKIDYNFDITSYRFDAPGTHAIAG